LGKEWHSAGTKLPRPTGVTILGILYILGGIGFMIGSAGFAVLGNYLAQELPAVGYADFASALSGFLVVLFVILGIIWFVIAGGLLAGKTWGRNLVIGLVILDLMIEAVTIFVGNLFALAGIIFDLIVLYYMWRPHVVEYFKSG